MKKIEIPSIFVVSFNNIFHKNIFPIFIIHLALTAVLAAAVTFYFYDYMSGLADEVVSYLSGLYSYSNFFSTIGNIIMFILAWLLFTSVLIPISSITGLIFEDKLSEKINILSNSNLEINRTNVSLLSFIFLILKNLFFYIFFNILALPFYFFLPPPFNIIIFILINGYLLGMQTFHGIIINYYDTVKIHRCLSKNRFNIFMIGSFLTLGFLVPVLNLFAPLLTIIVLINYFILISSE